MRRPVMVFGVFDGLHEGHRAFLKTAKRLGDYLIVVVAPDSVVFRLKGQNPSRGVLDRMKSLRLEDRVDRVIKGDSRLGTYAAVKRFQPHVIALGYDQKALAKDLRSRMPSVNVKMMQAHHPRKYHSRFLKKI